MNEQALVSLVIPTRERPELVIRAVQSALSQTYQNLEIIVVIDGPDPSTIEALKQVADVRLRWIEQPLSSGACGARNRGADEAAGPWVAFLDDDDEWFPTKVEKQMRVAANSTYQYPVVSCRVLARRPSGDTVWPLKAYKNGTSMAEYLFCRSGIRQGEGFVQTSTLLAPKSLLQSVPFTAGLTRHQDWDWLMRIAARSGVGFEWAWEPLVMYDMISASSNISRARGWRNSYDWAGSQPAMTPKATAYFMATQVASRSSHDALGALPKVLGRAWRYPHACLLAFGLFAKSLAWRPQR
ncbi:MAG TPA: glycosyltransferase family 2 protein [Ktedonobacteraceae bacterium]|jgi:glycosyltransferase involved in cell wall biosynthesis|nr:glycosyltransferase family 2 protein [Ktedonobacteraceae bacterium]